METIRKPDVPLHKRFSMPKFPAVEIDGDIVFENTGVTVPELEAELKRRL